MESLNLVESLSVWTPADFPNEFAWSFTLTADDQRALIEYARGGPGEDLSRQIGTASAHWAELLVDGPGFVRLREFPVDALTERELERAYIGIGTLLGHPVGQDRANNLVTRIRDERLQAGPGVRRYQTNLSQGFHSDASDLVALLCVHPAKVGGKSKIVSAHALYNEMLRRDPHLVEVLYLPMPWSRHTETRPNESAYFELAPIAEVDGKPRISFIPWFIRQSQQHASAPRLTDDQLAALALLEEIANDPAFQISMVFQSGDVQLLNNTTVLHSRDAYLDHNDPSLRRCLLRLWLTIDTPVADEILRGGEVGP